MRGPHPIWYTMDEWIEYQKKEKARVEQEKAATILALKDRFKVTYEEVLEYWDTLSEREKQGYLKQMTSAGRILW